MESTCLHSDRFGPFAVYH